MARTSVWRARRAGRATGPLAAPGATEGRAWRVPHAESFRKQQPPLGAPSRRRRKPAGLTGRAFLAARAAGISACRLRGGALCDGGAGATDGRAWRVPRAGLALDAVAAFGAMCRACRKAPLGRTRSAARRARGSRHWRAGPALSARPVRPESLRMPSSRFGATCQRCRTQGDQCAKMILSPEELLPLLQEVNSVPASDCCHTCWRCSVSTR
jgi:hypothetical protein